LEKGKTMYTQVFVFTLIVASISANPISKGNTLEFRIVDCIQGDNETSTSHILEIQNFNGTCVKINQTEAGEPKVYLYVIPSSDDGVQIHIKSQNCSSTLTDIYLTECDEPEDSNVTVVPVTFGFVSLNGSDVDAFDTNNNETVAVVATEANSYTGPTIYETLHHLDDSDEEEETVTPAPQDQSQQITQKQNEINVNSDSDDDDD